jgi:hypothetical protein
MQVFVNINWLEELLLNRFNAVIITLICYDVKNKNYMIEFEFIFVWLLWFIFESVVTVFGFVFVL